MDIQSSTLTEIFELLPVHVPGWVSPVKPPDLAKGGIPRTLYDGNPRGLQCVIDPWAELQRHNQSLEAYDSVALYVNDDAKSVDGATVQPGDEQKRIALHVPHGYLRHGVNRLHYKVTRISGNVSPSRDLTVLYHLRAQANLDLVIPPDVVTEGVNAERAAAGVTFGCSYTNAESFDLVRLRIGNESFTQEVSDPSTPVTLTLYTADFEKVGDGVVEADFIVADQLGNSRISATRTLSVSLVQEDTLQPPVLVKPAVSPIDPSIYPDGIIVRVDFSAARPGDKARLQAPNALPGTPPFPTLEFNRNNRANFTLDAPLLQAHQGRNLRLEWVLIRDGAERASQALRLPILAPTLNLNFRNAPYSTVAGGRLNDIALESLINGTPQPDVSIVVTLPGGFTYGDGGSGSRTFVTDSTGVATVGEVRGASAIGSYTLNARSDTQTATAVVDIEEPGLIEWISVSSAPIEIVTAPDGQRLYASVPSMHAVAVIDTRALNVSKYIPVDVASQMLAISNDGQRLYTANRSNNANEIDTERQVFSRRLSVGSELAHYLAVSPDSARVYVSTWEWGNVHVFDTASAARIATIKFVESPAGLAFSPDGRRLYVAINNFSGVAARFDIIDTAGLGTIKQISLPGGSNPHMVTVSPDGRFAYVILYGSGQVAVVDTTSLSVTKYIVVARNPYQMVINQEGTFGYLTSAYGVISIINLQRNEVARTIELQGKPWFYGIALSLDGTHAYVCNSGENRIAVLRVG
jgi:YVTN family beta-propeller protein